ncbi:phage tail protein [Mucilaginibacter sp. ZT4R22]|uniref:Phage tail protein n=1 Tax=Mucilaginibacter pankratovii TaxID=2772110 RepID=A0ABR7WLH5_9SPHI|nr:phage tail protein [Mucilaginibacter pankratovii]MBD1363179.1 phage tail protein [Mucilaginibacter pankratovii]
MANNTSAGGYYPPVGFHFKVDFVGIGNDNDSRFQTVSGLNVEYDTEAYKEGGENRFEHKLPLRSKYPDLSLKRGMLTDSKVIRWVLDALQNRTFKPVQINVMLLNEEHQPLKTWNIFNAWPKKWAVSDFNAQENSVVIETLDISYNYFTVK